MKKAQYAERLLAFYRNIAFAAALVFMFFVFLLFIGIMSDRPGLVLNLSILLSGMLWIGMTALCRHIYVSLKSAISAKTGMAEFLATSLVVFLFPVFYARIKRQVRLFTGSANAQESSEDDK